MKYMIQGRDNSQRARPWTEDVLGCHEDDNTFDSREEAEAMLPGLVKAFIGDEPAPTIDDFRVVERS